MIDQVKRSGTRLVRKLVPWRRELLMAGALLAGLLGALLLPTLQTIRSVEIDPKQKESPLALKMGEAITNVVSMVPGEFDYFAVWVEDKPRKDIFTVSDYEAIQLEVVAPDGQLIRSVSQSTAIKREEKQMLLFMFEPLQITEPQRYTFTLRQQGDGTVWLYKPLADHIENEEVIITSLQVGKQRNWLTLLLHKVYAERFDGYDVASYVHRGQQIVRGENPYSCVSDICVGYPGHLPGMYVVAAGLVALGFDELHEWVVVWRPIVLVSWLAVGLVLFGYFFLRRQPALAVAALGLWLFNRWSIEVLKIAHTDFIGTFFLLMAVLMVSRWPMTAAVLLGVSLAVKHVALLVVPLFIIVVWRSRKMRVGTLVALVGLIALVPVIVTLPFLIDDPRATVEGLLHVVDRPAQTVHGFAPALDTVLDVTDSSRWLPMLLLVGGVYAAAWRRSLTLIGGTLLVLSIMFAFTDVLYNQYIVWVIPFIILAGAQHLSRQKHDHEERASVSVMTSRES